MSLVEKKRSFWSKLLIVVMSLVVAACSGEPSSDDDGQEPSHLLACLSEYHKIDLHAEASLQAELSFEPIQSENDEVCCGTVGCLSQIEQEFERWRQEPVSLLGQVVDEQGRVVANARVSIADVEVTTDFKGVFHVTVPSRKNRWLRIEADGFRSLLLGVHLTGSPFAQLLQLGPFVLHRNHLAPKKLLFAGDFMMGRRYMDPQGLFDEFEIPVDDPSAWIQPSNPALGSRRVVSFVKPIFDAADWATVNLETTVTQRPTTPDMEKKHIYFTLPGSLAGLQELKISHVGMANNHVCDYQSMGFRDTLEHLNGAGIAYYGAGMDRISAFGARYVNVGDTSLALLAMTSVGPGDTTSCAAADDGFGAADLSDLDSVRKAIAHQRQAGHLPIVQLHTGWEYTYEPPESSLKYMHAAADSGAGLVVAHHPHMAQGFSIYNDVLLMYSLGNFVFDQYRNETMLSFAAEVRLKSGVVSGVEIIPVFVEDYAPRVVAGPLGARLIRRLAEFSDPPGIALTQRAGRGWLDLDPSMSKAVSRKVVFPVNIGSDGWSIIDLRGIAGPAESLVKINADHAGIKVRTGRDLLHFGDFEDNDIDEDLLELSRWELVGGSRPCTFGMRGAGALCLQTDGGGSHVYASSADLYDQVRLLAFADASDQLTLFGYLQATCADSTKAHVSLLRQDGSVARKRTYELVRAGTHPWIPFARDIDLGIDDYGLVEGVKIGFRYTASQPVSTGRVVLDDIAVISWDGNEQVDPKTVQFAGQHAKDFLRVSGPIGSHELELHFDHYPAAVCMPTGRMD